MGVIKLNAKSDPKLKIVLSSFKGKHEMTKKQLFNVLDNITDSTVLTVKTHGKDSDECGYSTDITLYSDGNLDLLGLMDQSVSLPEGYPSFGPDAYVIRYGDVSGSGINSVADREIEAMTARLSKRLHEWLGQRELVGAGIRIVVED